ncbi:hypothetical protein [Stenotrophomonas sp. GD03958]|uniref:hypothetical protein n=1 Tax=Stenotrophomonas sp. GD03958 TaxID=2975411 RepID=UPI002449E00D|nr:hypothetical protein [Stenotrophomonas sp. GD03958]MDH1194629.1 hypothetical protein [Stenotrophomonas sp. GD03958]
MDRTSRTNESSWQNDLKEIAATIRENTSFFVGGIVFLCGASIAHFCMQERIAINVLSSDFVAFIPLFFAIIIVLIVVIGAFLGYICTLVMEGAARSKRGRLMAVAIIPDRGSFFRTPVQNFVRINSPQWLLLLWSPGLLFTAAATGMLLFNTDETASEIIVILWALISFSVLTLCARLIRRPHRHRFKHSSVLSNFPSGILQVFAMFLVASVAANAADGAGYGTVAVLLTIALSTLLVALLQFAAVLAIVRSSHFGVVRQAFWGGLLTVSLACIFPTTSAPITRAILSMGSTGTAGCVRLAIDAQAKPMASLIDRTLQRDAPVVWTKPLGRVIPFGESLQLKLAGKSSPVYMLDRKDLRQSLSCKEADEMIKADARHSRP